MAKCAIKLGLILVFIFLYCVPSFSEDITITTYYPSPYGSYNELEVRKRIRIKGDADGDGAITYNDSRHIVDLVMSTTRHDIYNETTTPSWVMDINNSGAVNIADAVALQTQVITNRETNIGYFYGNSSLPGLVVSKGNVGIGATSPNLKLEVYQTSGNGGLPVTSGTTQTFGIFRTRVGNAVFDTGGNTNGAQWIQATDATNLAVNYNLLLNPNGGSVGIGTTTAEAGAQLDVHGRSRIYADDPGTIQAHSTLAVIARDNPEIWMEDIGNNSGGIGINGAAGMILGTENRNIRFRTGCTFVGGMTSGADRLIIVHNEGRVQIPDNTTQNEELQIGNERGENVPGGGIQLGQGIPNDLNDKGGLTFREPFSDTGVYSAGDGQISLFANNSVAFWIMNHGGAGSPAITTERFYPVGIGWRQTGDININRPQARLHILGGGMTDVLRINNEFVDASPLLVVQNTGEVGLGVADPTYQLHLSTNSAYKPTSNVWATSSDARLKKDIKPFTDGLEVIKQIKPVSYKLNGKAGTPLDAEGISVIGQEIQKVAPYTIKTYRAKLEPTDKTKTELLNFDSSALTFVIINAIKEQQKEIEDLKAKIDSLEKKLAAQ